MWSLAIAARSSLERKNGLPRQQQCIPVCVVFYEFRRYFIPIWKLYAFGEVTSCVHTITWLGLSWFWLDFGQYGLLVQCSSTVSFLSRIFLVVIFHAGVSNAYTAKQINGKWRNICAPCQIPGAPYAFDKGCWHLHWSSSVGLVFIPTSWSDPPIRMLSISILYQL